MLYSTIYGGGSNHPTLGKGSDLEDPKRPGTFNRAIGAYRFNDAASLLRAVGREHSRSPTRTRGAIRRLPRPT